MATLRRALYWLLYTFGLPGLVLSQITLWLLVVLRLATVPKPDRNGIFWSEKRVDAVFRFRAFLRKIPLLGRLVRRKRLWGGHTFFGAGIWVSPAFSERGRRHEMQHVFQLFDCYLATGVLGLIAGSLGAAGIIAFSWPLAGALWACGALVWLASYLGALLRGERLYADAMIEKGAYSITNEIDATHVGKSWETILPETKYW